MKGGLRAYDCAMADDWRVMGQERRLAGATFVRKPYRVWTETWEHDHCEMCARKFVESDSTREDSETVTAGFAAVGRGPKGEDDYYWVCDECFDDFRDRFGWKVD